MLLSDGPASGRDVLASVAQALVLAAVVAVTLAALAGYLLSGRISKPLVALTATSDEMAEGHLGARADIDRDDEVGRLAASFNSMADRIEATVTTLRRFVADAAHEIGTPLTALQADLELAEEPAGVDERVFVRRALEQARRIEDLSANLLRLSRLEAGETDRHRGARRPRSADARDRRRSGVAGRAGRARVRRSRVRRADRDHGRQREASSSSTTCSITRSSSRRTVARWMPVSAPTGATPSCGCTTRASASPGRAARDLQPVLPRTQCGGLSRQRPGPCDRAGDGRGSRRDRGASQR